MEDRDALNSRKGTLRRIGAAGFMLFAIGFWMREKTPGLLLAFVGLGVAFFCALYERSISKRESYQMIPKN
jgi:hypothetical protein